MEKRRNDPIWTWKRHKMRLPVTCGDLEGILSRERMAQGMPCIIVNKMWITPSEFEKLGGKQSWRNWKKSIRCQTTPLEKLIKEGHLQAPNHIRAIKKTNKTHFSSDVHEVSAGSTGEQDEDFDAVADKANKSTYLSDELRSVNTVTCYERLSLPVHIILDYEDDDDEEEQMEQQSESSNKMVFQVKCGALSGMLHKQRFASENRGKSIRTETCWMSPVEFANQGSSQRNASWKTDIQWDGKPLSVLIEENVLKIHPVACDCRVCSVLWEDEEKNDRECFICKRADRQLVMCSSCPRSFHTTCHQPHLDIDVLLRDDQWQCTFCVFSLNQAYFYHQKWSLECAMARKISQHMLESQYLLLRLCSVDEKQIFTNPIDIKDDSAVMKTPMSLANIAENIQKKRYQTVGDFVYDVQHIFRIYASYNKDNAELQATIKSLQTFFGTEFMNVFDIHEESVNK